MITEHKIEIQRLESSGKSSWGVVITYNTPEEKENIVEEIENEFSGTKRINLRELSSVDPSIGVINCIDISGQREVMLGDIDAGQRVTGWVKSYKIVLLCKEWEWKLLQSRDGRWTSHLDFKPEEEIGGISQAAQELADQGTLDNRNSRFVLYEYLNSQSLFNEFLDTTGIKLSKIQSIIEQKGLWEMDEREYDLLLKSDKELLRYIAAKELDSRRKRRFNREEFTDLFGEIPILMGLQADTEMFDDLLLRVREKEFNSPEDFADVESLVGLLKISDFVESYHNALADFLGSERQEVYDALQECEDRDGLESRVDYLNQFINTRETENLASAFASTLCLVQMEKENTPNRLLQHYNDELKPQSKTRVSRLLVHQIEIEAFTPCSNHRLIVDFLQEDGPKLVVLLDGLPLTDEATRAFYSNKESDSDWNTEYGIAPIPTVTKQFRQLLTDQYPFTQLGGFYEDSENLSMLDLDAFIGEEKEEELVTLLNRGESVIIYDPQIDQGGHFPTDVNIKVRDYLEQKIPEFVDKYGEFADILITSDHGMVETFEPEKLSRPDSAGQRGFTHCRSTFVDKDADVESELVGCSVSYIKVGLPNSNDDCLMINPDNPHSKFGNQTGNLWIHGGISIEESVVPVMMRRR